MQIYSYVSSNVSNPHNVNVTLDSLIKNQHPARVNREAVAREIPDYKDFFAGFGKALGMIISKLKIVFFTIIALYVLALFVPYFIMNINFSIKPIELDIFTETEEVLLDKAMTDFVFSSISEGVDNFGEIALSGSKTPYMFQPVEYQKYSVKPGENITRISKKFGLSNISTLISVNGISNDRSLQAGQKLTIPSMDGIIHTVAKNENLSSIAGKYGVTVESLLDVNDLSTDVLAKGQKLFIPGARLDSTSLKLALGELFKTPITAKWRLTSPFGNRADPFTGVKKFHTGIDMACPTGTPIRASLDGKVVASGYNSVYGNYVIISHTNGYQTLYAHMSKRIANVGQRVRQGDKIGLVGSTGYSTGPHLHFTVYKNGKLVDPLPLIR